MVPSDSSLPRDVTVLRPVRETGSECASAHPGESGAETSKHLPHVSSFLHADDTQVVLLIYPNQEGLLVIVPADKSTGLTTDGPETKKKQDVNWVCASSPPPTLRLLCRPPTPCVAVLTLRGQRSIWY